MPGQLQPAVEAKAVERANAPTVEGSMQQIIERQQAAIAKALPRGMDEARFARILVTTVKQTPDLLKCSTASLLGAAMQAAALGLEPGPLGECYLVPYGRDCSFIPGAPGLVKLAIQSGYVSAVVARTVWEGDEFDYDYGLDEHLVHKPCGDEEKPTHHYAIAKMTNGTKEFVVMTQGAIDKHRAKFAKSQKAWRENPEAMARKTVVKQLMKLIPKSAEVQRAMNADEQTVNLLPSGDLSIVDLGEIRHGDGMDVPPEPMSYDALEATATEGGQPDG